MTYAKLVCMRQGGVGVQGVTLPVDLACVAGKYVARGQNQKPVPVIQVVIQIKWHPGRNGLICG